MNFEPSLQSKDLVHLKLSEWLRTFTPPICGISNFGILFKSTIDAFARDLETSSIYRASLFSYLLLLVNTIWEKFLDCEHRQRVQACWGTVSPWALSLRKLSSVNILSESVVLITEAARLSSKVYVCSLDKSYFSIKLSVSRSYLERLWAASTKINLSTCKILSAFDVSTS